MPTRLKVRDLPLTSRLGRRLRRGKSGAVFDVNYMELPFFATPDETARAGSFGEKCNKPSRPAAGVRFGDKIVLGGQNLTTTIGQILSLIGGGIAQPMPQCSIYARSCEIPLTMP